MSKGKILTEKITNIEKISFDVYKISIQSEYISKNAIPGQFINVKCGNGLNTLLRRPFSINNVDMKNNIFDIAFQIKGTGTERLSQMKKGDYIDIIGPLGRFFDLSPDYKRIAIIGGGIGIFPLLFLLNKSDNCHKTAFLGFKNKESIIFKKEFESVSDDLRISTDDGSYGYKGLITDLLHESLKEAKYDIIYSCGPKPMLIKIAEIAQRENIRCQVSLEERMGCGIGACLVCVCKTRDGGGWKYSHVCKDGPVFWSNEVILSE